MIPNIGGHNHDIGLLNATLKSRSICDDSGEYQVDMIWDTGMQCGLCGDLIARSITAILPCCCTWHVSALGFSSLAGFVIIFSVFLSSMSKPLCQPR